MEWKSISMHDRLALLKERRKDNPDYKYFDLRNEYDTGKDPMGAPAKFNSTIASIPDYINETPVSQDIPTNITNNVNNQQYIQANNTPTNYSTLTNWSKEYSDNNWKMPVYDNSKYNPSNNIRRQIVQWEGDSMRTNKPISRKANELTNNYLKDLTNYLTPEQLDSLTSYYYNIKPMSFAPTLKQLNRLRTVQNKEQYNDVLNGVVNSINVGYNNNKLSGLRKRRDRERYIFLHGYK